jgi:hypothetical protein
VVEQRDPGEIPAEDAADRADPRVVARDAQRVTEQRHRGDVVDLAHLESRQHHRLGWRTDAVTEHEVLVESIEVRSEPPPDRVDEHPHQRNAERLATCFVRNDRGAEQPLAELLDPRERPLERDVALDVGDDRLDAVLESDLPPRVLEHGRDLVPRRLGALRQEGERQDGRALDRLESPAVAQRGHEAGSECWIGERLLARVPRPVEQREPAATHAVAFVCEERRREGRPLGREVLADPARGEQIESGLGPRLCRQRPLVVRPLGERDGRERVAVLPIQLGEVGGATGGDEHAGDLGIPAKHREQLLPPFLRQSARERARDERSRRPVRGPQAQSFEHRRPRRGCIPAGRRRTGDAEFGEAPDRVRPGTPIGAEGLVHGTRLVEPHGFEQDRTEADQRERMLAAAPREVAVDRDRARQAVVAHRVREAEPGPEGSRTRVAGALERPHLIVGIARDAAAQVPRVRALERIAGALGTRDPLFGLDEQEADAPPSPQDVLPHAMRIDARRILAERAIGELEREQLVVVTERLPRSDHDVRRIRSGPRQIVEAGRNAAGAERRARAEARQEDEAPATDPGPRPVRWSRLVHPSRSSRAPLGAVRVPGSPAPSPYPVISR